MREANLYCEDFFHQCFHLRWSWTRFACQRAGMLWGMSFLRRRGGRRQEGLDVPDTADLAIWSARLLGEKLTWPGVQWICRLRTLCEWSLQSCLAKRGVLGFLSL